MAIWLPLEFPHLLREAILWNVPEQLKLSKHLDRMVEEVGCNLKVVERSEATAYVVLERSVKIVERIVYAHHTAESMGEGLPGLPRRPRADPRAR